MTLDDEAKIARAFRLSLGVVLAASVIGAGTWLIVSIPKSPVIDPTPPTGPGEGGTSSADRALGLPPIPFTDIAESAGLHFVHDTGATGEKFLSETMVGGVAVIDADSDGRQDLVLASASKVSLFLNRTPPGGAISFTPAPDTGLASPGMAMGFAVGDFDADGRTDLYVTGVGANRLYRNATEANGPVRFTDATEAAGADPKGDHPRWGTSAGFFDADGDGDLDLLVANYVRWSREIDERVDFRLAGLGRAYGPPNGFEGDDLLYLRNRGDGTFEDATIDAGFRVRSSTGAAVGKALGLVFVDPDADGDLDVVVANDTVANGFFVNDGRGHFTEQGAASGLAYDRNGAATGAMGIDAGWLRAREHAKGADLAIAIGNFANEPDSLYVSQGGRAIFTDDAVVEGLAAPTRGVLTFGLLFLDLDLDGDLDIAQANGHIEDEIGRIQPSQSFAQRGQVFVNTGGRAPCLIELPKASIGDLATARVGRGLASADFDGDGDEDLVMAQAGGPVALLRNDAAKGHWLQIELVGSPGNPSAIGAQIELTAAGKTQRRLISPTRSYLSQCDGAAHFGLGSATNVERLSIRWPDGPTETIPVEGIDRTMRVVEPKRPPANSR